MAGALNSPMKRVSHAMRRSTDFTRRCGERLQAYGPERKSESVKKMKVHRNSAQKDVLEEIARQKREHDDYTGIKTLGTWLLVSITFVIALAVTNEYFGILSNARFSLNVLFIVFGIVIILSAPFCLVAMVYVMFVKSSAETKRANYAATLMPKIKKGNRIKKKKLAKKVHLPIQRSEA